MKSYLRKQEMKTTMLIILKNSVIEFRGILHHQGNQKERNLKPHDPGEGKVQLDAD